MMNENKLSEFDSQEIQLKLAYQARYGDDNGFT